jgi:RNA polymerase sigma factor (sigma-70 family)
MSELDKQDFTKLLQQAQDGDTAAENRLFSVIDDELRRIAQNLCTSDIARPTSLVNDAYVYLFSRIKERKDLDLKNRRYFFKSIADCMRNILLDRYKKRRPGPWDPALDAYLEDFRAVTSWNYEMLHEVLGEFLKSEDAKKRRRHQLINLHFFGGLTYKAAAQELGISTSQYQIDRDRALAELQQAIASRTS